MGWKQSLIFVEKRPQESFSMFAKLTFIYIKTGPWGPTRYIFGNQVTCWITYEIMIWHEMDRTQKKLGILFQFNLGF